MILAKFTPAQYQEAESFVVKMKTIRDDSIYGMTMLR